MLCAGWAAMSLKQGMAQDPSVCRAAIISRLSCSSCLPAVKLGSSPCITMTSA